MIELTIAYAVLFATTLAACGFLLREQRRQHDREVALLQDQLEAEREVNSDLMDRWYLTKNLPPAGANMQERDEQRRQDADRRQQAPRPPVDPLKRAHATLASEEKRSQAQS